MASQAIVNAFFVLWMWPSHLALPILVATVLFARPKIERHPAFVNMCITEILGGIAMSILLYTNYHQLDGPNPPRALCQFQASLLAGANAMTSFSLFGLVYQVYHSVRQAANSKINRNPAFDNRRTWALIILPYFIWLIFALATSLYGTSHPSSIVRGTMPYCAVASGSIKYIAAILDTAILVATLVFEVLALVSFLGVYKSKGRKNALVDLTMRIGAFALLISGALALAAASIFMPKNPAPDLVMATMGSFLFLIFGTQRDILRAWATILHLPARFHPRGGASVVPPVTPASATLREHNHNINRDTKMSSVYYHGGAQFTTFASVDSTTSFPTMEGMPPMRERDEKDPGVGMPGMPDMVDIDIQSARYDARDFESHGQARP